jgi:hypothetical protein
VRTARPALRIAVQAATMAATILSTSMTAAEVSPSSAEWPTGEGWIIQVGPQELKRAAHDWEIPDSPLLPDAVTPKTVITVPTDFKFNVTLTIRHNDKSLENHGTRARHPVGTAHCGNEAPRKLRPARCRGWVGHPRARH